MMPLNVTENEAVTTLTVTPVKHGSKVKSQITPCNPTNNDSLVRENCGFVPFDKF